MRVRRSGLLAAGLLAATCLAGGDRAATGLALPLPSGRLDIGRIAIAPSLSLLAEALVPGALAQGTAGVVLDDVRWSMEGVSVVAPRVEVSGTSLTKTDLAALLDAAAPTPLPERLARLSATAVAIPELRVEQEVAGTKQVSVYRDLRAGPVSQGRVAALSAAGATLSTTGGPREGQGSYGRLDAADLDLAGLARLYGERTEAPGPLMRLYGRFAVQDIRFADARGVVVTIAQMSGRDLAARPIRGSWRDASRSLAAVDLAKATPEARAAFLGTAAEMLDGFDLGGLELKGLKVAGANGREGGLGEVERLSYDGVARTARLDRLSVAGGGGRGTLDAVTLSGFSLAPTIEAMRRLARDPEGVKEPSALRGLVPQLGTLHLEGLGLDLPGAPGKDPAAPPVPIKAGLRSADLSLDAMAQGVPTATRLALAGLMLTVPQAGQAGALEPVAALGYRDLDLAATIDSRWDPATGEVAVKEISVSGKDMGAVRVTGTVAGVTKDVLDPDTAVSSVALLGATAKALSLDIENKGLFERIVAQQAKTQSLTPEALRREYGTAAAIGIPAVLGNGPAARTLGQAVARFVAKPGRLTVAATAKDPDGFGVADVSMARSPAAILDRLTITATAE